MSKLAKALSGAAGNAGGDPLYVEDVFSTFLYEGSGSTRSIDNGIALSDEGGLVWLKNRDANDSHALIDTINGPTKRLSSNSTDAAQDLSDYFSFPSAGTTGFNLIQHGVNSSGQAWASWSFRKAEKFFDVVTYTGDGASDQTIAHNLGSVPGCIFLKRVSAAGVWSVLGSDNSGNYKALRLDSTAASSVSVTKSNVATDSAIDVGYWSSDIKGSMNTAGVTYVAYLFASDAGGYGDDGTENIIKCGSFNSTALTNLGWEPQWVMMKRTDSTSGWFMMDNMRGMTASTNTTTYNGTSQYLYANTSAAEAAATGVIAPAATGFGSGQSGTYIYIAIRRPMKTPEAGTEVFGLRNFNETNDYQQLTTGNLVDLGWEYLNSNGALFFTRMLGAGYLNPTTTGAANTSAASAFDFMDGFEPHYANNVSGFSPRMVYGFTRATGFMDVVAYTGTGGSSRAALTHNLGVVPELVIVKSRSNTAAWFVLSTSLGQFGFLNIGDGFSTTDLPYAFGDGSNYVAPTSTAFKIGSSINGNTQTFIAYLFATLAGVSKVGTYTGTAATQNIDCGFTAGARFILIKRANGATNTGDWYVWDSVRGIVAGNDPYLLLNTTAAQVTNTDYIDPLNAGFTVTSSAPAALNASGGNYIFLAIAQDYQL